ncbi:YihY/virulence factor BrkB family protein [Thermaurantiacus sp.]
MGRPFGPAIALVREIVGAAWQDGSLHAGNFAYLALVTLFPAAILVTALAGLAGRSEAGSYAIAGVLGLLPPAVRDVIGPLLDEVIAGSSRGALGLSVLVGLWTVSGFLDTLRGIISRAYRAQDDRPFWKTRLLATAASLAFAASVLLSVAISLLLTLAFKLLARLDLGFLIPPLAWLAPILVAFAALWALFASLAPRVAATGPHWPGALVVILLWTAATLLFDPILAAMGGMARTYGALAGVMLALLFFYGIGFAIVLGAETNAALARHRQAGSGHKGNKGMRG